MSDRPALDAVVLDAGGTLGRLDFEWMAECVTGLGHPVDAATLRAAEVEGRKRYDESAGHVHPAPEPLRPLGGIGDVRAYLQGTLAAAGVPAALADPAFTRFMEREKSTGLWTRVMEGAPEALRGLEQLGVRRAVVSNSDGRAAQHIEAWGLLAELEFVIDSAIVGIEKPDPRIFQIALDRLGVTAARALYVGDIRCVDEAGSRAAGMHFVLIDPTGRYAAPGAPRIASIADLPGYIEHHFEITSRTDGAAAGTGHAAGPDVRHTERAAEPREGT